MASDNRLDFNVNILDEQFKKKLREVSKEITKATKDWEKKLTVNPKVTNISSQYKKETKIAENSIVDLKNRLRELQNTKVNLDVNSQEFVNASKQAFELKQRIVELEKREEIAAKKTLAAERLAVRERAKARREAEKAARQLERQQRNTARAVTGANSAYRRQSRLLQNLNTLGASYISIFALGRIVSNIREVTGEFELQNKALAAIIQNKEKADSLFIQVTDLATRSPFAIRELVAYTKQLAAYRIETDQLFGSLTKLADISAGLGVDMSRLILAFGQVRAASVLRGQELRQFTEAGIPLIGLLADKFSELEGRVVSTNEVFQRISSRMVSFRHVSEIFDDLTAKGGVFFEAQRVQAETLAGQWSILSDELDKAYNRIGQDNLGLFKDGLSLATDFAKNLDTIISTIKDLVVAYGAYRVALVVSNSLRAKEIVLNRFGVKSFQQLTIANRAAAIQQARSLSITNRLTSSYQRMGKALSGNIYAIAITGLVLLGQYLHQSYQESQRLNNELNTIGAKGFSKSSELVSGFERLAEATLKSADGSKSQRENLEELNRTYKDYLPNQGLNISNLRDMKGAYDEVTEAIRRKNRASAQEKVDERLSAELTESTSKAIDKLIKGLSAQNDVSKEAAVQIATVFKETIAEELDKGIDLGATENVNRIINTIFNDFTGSPIRSKFLDLSFSRIIDGANDYAKAVKRISEARANAENTLDALFNRTEARTQKELDSINTIKDAYKERQKELRNQPLSEEEFNNKSLELQKNELREIIKLYEDLELKSGVDSDDLYNTIKIEEYTKKLQKLTGDLGIYQESVRRIINETKDINNLDPIVGKLLEVGDEEDLSVHQQRVLDVFKQTKQTIEQTTNAIAEYNKQGITDSRLKTEERGLKLQQDQLVVVKALIEAFNIKDKKTSSKGETTALGALRNELKLIKEIDDARKKLQKTLDRDSVSDKLVELFGADAKSFGIELTTSFDDKALTENLSRLSKEAREIGGNAGIALSESINRELNNIDVDNVSKNAKDALELIDNELKSYQKKTNFYKQLFGITQNKELSVNIAFGITEQTDANLEGFIRDKIADISKDVANIIPDDITSKAFEEVFANVDFTKFLGEDQVSAVKKYYEQIQQIQVSETTDTLKKLIEINSKYASIEAQKTSVHKKFADLRLALDSKYNKQTEKDKIEALKRLGEAEAEEIAAIDKVLLASTESYRQLYGDLENTVFSKLISIRDKWEEILSDINSQEDTDGIFTLEIDGETVQLTEKQIEKITKRVLKLKEVIEDKNLFLGLKKGFDDLLAGDISGGIDSISNSFDGLVGSIQPLFEALDELGQATGNTGLSDMAQDISSVLDFSKDLINLGSAIASGNPAAIVQEVVNVTVKLIKAEAEYQEAKRKALLDNIKLQNEYNRALLDEALLFRDGQTIFNVEAFEKAQNAVKVYKDIMSQLADEYDRLNKKSRDYVFNGLSLEIKGMSDLDRIMIKTGVRRRKFLGITLGKKDVYEQLTKVYPDIIDAEGKLNIERAKAIINTDKLNDADKERLDNIIKLTEASQDAFSQLQDYLSGIFGSLGDEISDAIVNSFVNGQDAMEAFASSTEKTLENMVVDISKSLVLAPYFRDLQKQLEDVYSKTDLSPERRIQEVIKTMRVFYNGLDDKLKESEEILKASQDAARAEGFDIFTAQQELGSLAKTISGVTEDTARRLEAIMNSIREQNILQSGEIRQMAQNIENTNSLASQQLVYVQTIQQDLAAYIISFNSLIKQGSSGAGLKTYVS